MSKGKPVRVTDRESKKSRDFAENTTVAAVCAAFKPPGTGVSISFGVISKVYNLAESPLPPGEYSLIRTESPKPAAAVALRDEPKRRPSKPNVQGGTTSPPPDTATTTTTATTTSSSAAPGAGATAAGAGATAPATTASNGNSAGASDSLDECAESTTTSATGTSASPASPPTSPNLQATRMTKRTSTHRGAKLLRIERNLYLRVIEARGLKGVDFGGTSDPYVLVTVGEGQSLRTPTIWRTTDPVWNNEATFTLKEFGNVQATVYDENRIGKSVFLGQVSIPRQSLMDRRVHEQWYPLLPREQSDADSVAGDIHVRARLIYTDTEGSLGVLSVTIVEARNLASKDSNGLSDPYVVLSVGDEERKTSIRKKTLSPTYNESFSFEIKPKGGLVMFLTVWDWDLVGGDDFMGQVRLSLSEIDPDRPFDRWFDLCPSSYQISRAMTVSSTVAKGTGYTAKKDTPMDNIMAQDDAADNVHPPPGENELGYLRLKVTYAESRILPLKDYKDLASVVWNQGVELITILGSCTREREPVALNFIRLYDSKGQLLEFVSQILERGVDDTIDTTVIFRGNTIVTKLVDVFMRIVGRKYVADVLRPLVAAVFADETLCALSPEEASQATDQLLPHAARLIDAVLASSELCPREFIVVFTRLAAATARKFPDLPNMRHMAVASFIFLRLFCSALLTPLDFDVVTVAPEATRSKILTVLAKKLQLLANIAGLDLETTTREIEPFLRERVPKMREFVNQISHGVPETRPVPEASPPPQPVIEMTVTEPDEAGGATRLMRRTHSTSSVMEPSTITGTVDVERELACVKEHLARAWESIELYPVDNPLSTQFVAELKDILARLAEAEVLAVQQADQRRKERVKENFQRIRSAVKNSVSKRSFLIPEEDGILIEGCTFLKSVKYGKPKSRFVYCSVTENALCWRESKASTETDRKIPLVELKGVACGGFRKQKKRPESTAGLEFSVLADGRTLDLFASSAAECDSWVAAFTKLITRIRGGVLQEVAEYSESDDEAIAAGVTGVSGKLEDSPEVATVTGESAAAPVESAAAAPSDPPGPTSS